MYGQLPRNLDEKLVDVEQSYLWLKSGNIKGETENTTVAAQNQAISKNDFKNKVLKEETDSKHRLCKQHEDIDHLTSNITWATYQESTNLRNYKNNSHIGHCIHTFESANVKVQNIFHGRNNITCSTNCKYKTTTTLCI